MTTSRIPADPLGDFLAQRTLAVVGVSRDPDKWGSLVHRDLKSKGYTVHAINPKMTEIDGDPCYPSLAALPEIVGGVIVVTPPPVTERIVREARDAGIRRVWLQEGAESEEAIAFCRANGMSVIHGVCVMVQSR